MTTPKTGAPELVESQADKEETANEAFRVIEAGAGLFRVEDNDATDPPGSCADGAQYIPAATAAGLWAGKEKHIAIAVGANAANGWYFIAPEEGMRAWVKDENAEFAYDGSAWVAYTAAPSGTGTAATLDFDTDGALAANSDALIPTQKAVKTAIAAAVAGLSWKQAVRVATTAAGTLASSFENGDTVDGVALVTGDRILIKDQAAPAENGIYVVAASGAPARATDADSGAELVNASCYVSEGTANADTQWTCTTNATITVGATSLTFAQINTTGLGYTALKAGKVSYPVGAGAMTPRTTNGAAAGSAESTTNKVMTTTLDFDAATDEFAQFSIPMPNNWNESTVTAQFYWTATNTGNVIWGIQGVALSDDDALDSAFGTAQLVTDGVTAAGDLMISAETSAMTIAGTPAAGDLVVFQVYRDANDGSDTCTVDAKLIAVKLFITLDAEDEA